MVAITPLDINFLIRSMGLFPTTWARSRITILAGISILFPLLLIGPPPQITNLKRPSWDVVVRSMCGRGPVSNRGSHGTTRPTGTLQAVRLIREGIHKIFQVRALIRRQCRLQGIG